MPGLEEALLGGQQGELSLGLGSLELWTVPGVEWKEKRGVKLGAKGAFFVEQKPVSPFLPAAGALSE